MGKSGRSTACAIALVSFLTALAVVGGKRLLSQEDTSKASVTVTGRVIAPKGHSLAGFKLVFLPQWPQGEDAHGERPDAPSYAPARCEVFVGDDGVYKAEVSPGFYRLVVQSPSATKLASRLGRETSFGELVVDELEIVADKAATIDLTLGSFSVAGSAAEYAGKPLKDIVVLAEQKNRPSTLANPRRAAVAVTDDNGSYELLFLDSKPAGEYAFSWQLPDDLKKQGLALAAGPPSRFDLSAAREPDGKRFQADLLFGRPEGSVKGHILVEGQKSPGKLTCGLFSIANEDMGEPRGTHFTTAEDGSFSAGALLPGTYFLCVAFTEKDGYAASFPASAEQRAFFIVSPAKIAVSGTPTVVEQPIVFPAISESMFSQWGQLALRKAPRGASERPPVKDGIAVFLSFIPFPSTVPPPPEYKPQEYYLVEMSKKVKRPPSGASSLPQEDSAPFPLPTPILATWDEHSGGRFDIPRVPQGYHRVMLLPGDKELPGSIFPLVCDPKNRISGVFETHVEPKNLKYFGTLEGVLRGSTGKPVFACGERYAVIVATESEYITISSYKGPKGEWSLQVPEGSRGVAMKPVSLDGSFSFEHLSGSAYRVFVFHPLVGIVAVSQSVVVKEKEKSSVEVRLPSQY